MQIREISEEDTFPFSLSRTPIFTPEDWVYTDGSYNKEQDRLGAAVVHIPSHTTLYIDDAG